MKGTMWYRLGYLGCALAGCLTGVGLFALVDTNEVKQNTTTKDNTLVREVEDSVFFVEERKEQEQVTLLELPEKPMVTPAIDTETEVKEPATTEVQENGLPEETEKTEISQTSETESSSGEFAEEEVQIPMEDTAFITEGQVSVPTEPRVVSSPPTDVVTPEPRVTEVITYPAKIFGQTPVINRSDAYVSYFEFAYDLIATLEPEVTARGQNINVLLTKFAVKALLCGVDIEKLDINAPIPRRLAALCLWLAAQVLNENGCNTSSKSAGKYVTDISGCSSSEKKAIAYLYEQGIINGYQAPGQRFYPDAGVKTATGADWLHRTKQCWK